MLKKIIIFGILIIFVIIIIKLFILPKPAYEYGNWAKPYNPEEHKYSFCTYTSPVKFTFLSYHHDIFYQKEMVMFKNNETNGHLLLFKLREFPDIDVTLITSSNKSIIKSYEHETTSFEDNVDFISMLPIIFINKKIDASDKSLLVRGLRVSNKFSVNQNAADIMCFKGEFERIAFIKKSKGLYKSPIPVLDFNHKKRGYLSIIKSKELPESFFVLYYADSFDNLNETDFVTFLKTITFEKKTPYLKKLYEDAYKSGSLVDVKTMKPLKKEQSHKSAP